MASILLDQTNPVYNTAKLTLSILSRAGVPEAVDYAERLGFTDIRKNYDVNEDNGSELPQAILQEARYAFLNRVIRESKCKNIVDIACGFSPRGYIMAKEGYNYRGIDLDASVDALSSIAAELGKDGLAGSLSYVACDLTDPDAFENALADIEGEVLIICEGLMMYLKPYEGRSLFRGLNRVLTSHGGRFVTPDFEMGPIYVGVHVALLGREEGMKALMAMANTTSGKADNDKWKGHISSKEAQPEKVLAEEGLSVERVDFYRESEKCYVFEQMKEADAAGVIAALKTMKGWSITANRACEAAKRKKNADYDGPYRAEYAVKEDVLRMTVRGRVDSMTSGDLLGLYNEAGKGRTYRSVVLDCTDLTYISSAGLRVLLTMKKDLKDGAVSLEHASDEVKEIIRTTGFDSIVTVCE